MAKTAFPHNDVGLTRCEDCGMGYCANIPADQRDHDKRHQLLDQVTTRFGMRPLSYAEQERVKRAGWEMVHGGASIGTRVRGAEDVLSTHWSRSVECAMSGGYWRSHPTFSTFVRMMRYRQWDEALESAIRDKYGAFIPNAIPWGASYWYPPNSKERRDQEAQSLEWARKEPVSLGRQPAPAPEGAVYFIQGESGGPIKIGMARNVRARMASLQTAHHSRLHLLGQMPGGSALESQLHRQFAAHRLQGEWFAPTAELLAYIAGLKP